jgi:site-specific recombinase XerD
MTGTSLALIDDARALELASAVDAAVDFAQASRSPATRRAYESDFRDFEGWCAAHGASALPATPAAVAAYVGALGAGRRFKASTITRRISAITFAHRQAGQEPPTSAELVRATIKGLRNTLGTRPAKKAPLTADLVLKALRKIPGDTLLGLRDRALLSVLFAGALRRSEAVALDVEHLEARPRGLLLHLARSKGDQEGKGQLVAVPMGKRIKAPEAVEAWRRAAGIDRGPLFRGVAKGGRVLEERLCDRQVARVVKARAKAIGLNPELFSGHSLRSGFVTTAGNKGADIATTAKHLRHAKLETTLGYFQPEDAFRNHSGDSFL